MKENKINYIFITFIILISAMGGLLFGYDWVVIGGAKPFYEPFFGITDSPALQGWAMSSAIVGCLFGAILSGVVSDKYGRKLPLIFSAAMFTLSAVGTGMANSFSIFILYRLIGGFGIGMASVLSPIYIAELAPTHLRGRFVAINQLTIVVGILLAQIINFQIAEPVVEGASGAEIMASWNGQVGWRWMFWAETFFAGAFFLMAFFIPESPRWLIKEQRLDQALDVLSKVGDEAYAKSTLDEIEATVHEDDKHQAIDFKALKSKKVLSIIAIGVVFAMLQQLCGVNTVFNYADEIFSAAGYGVTDMLFNVVITGVVNVIFTLVAMKVVDSWGRRKLMLLGYGGLATIFILFGIFFKLQLTGFIMLLSVLVAIGIYAMTLAPTTWVVLSEIFPNKVRGVAMSIATFGLWTACFLLTYTFPIINNGLGASGTFWMYAGVCIVAFVFVRKYLPETKGKSLEEVEELFDKYDVK